MFYSFKNINNEKKSSSYWFRFDWRFIGFRAKKRFDWTVIGVDSNKENAQKAMELGIVDAISDLSIIKTVDIVILAVLSTTHHNWLGDVLEGIKENTLVFDVGSTKENICKKVVKHSKRVNFVAVHQLRELSFLDQSSYL